MIRKSSAVASVLGSAALAAVALTTPASQAAPTTAAPEAAPKISAALAYPAGSATIVKTKKHGEVTTSFKLVRSTASVTANCLVHAKAKVSVTAKGPVEVMKVDVSGLPKKTEFDFFVLQVPDFPFGLSWYQGDFETNRYGKATAKFVGRFSKETFTIAPGVAPAPVVHTSPTADANTNPVTRPVHQYHLGFWFNDPADATAAGCAGATTPFNGDHNAGVQAMSTAQFPVGAGPLKHIKS